MAIAGLQKGLAARLGAMGSLSAKSYVQDGLVAMWDGIENAGWGTHDASATTWKDLVGNNDTNTFPASTSKFIWSWESNSLSFIDTYDGAWGANYDLATISIDSALAESISSNSLTVECAFHTAKKEAQSLKRFYCILGWNNSEHHNYWYSSCVFDDSPLGPIDDSFANKTNHSISQSFLNGNLTSYNEGVFSLSQANKNTKSLVAGDVIKLLYASFYNNYYNNVYNTRIYNRALTAAEIAANYTIDQKRFNLT